MCFLDLDLRSSTRQIRKVSPGIFLTTHSGRSLTPTNTSRCPAIANIQETTSASEIATDNLSAPSREDKAPLDEGDESDEDWENPGCSLFEMNMPGVLTKEEVETQIDLDHWLLYDRDLFVEMEVRHFLFDEFHLTPSDL